MRLFIICVLILASLTFVILQDTPYTVGAIDLCFTHDTDCSLLYLNVVDDDMMCALYDVDKDALPQKFTDTLTEHNLVTDSHNKRSYSTSHNFGGLMHHKICVGADMIVTGSANPTHNGLTKNDNVMFLFDNASFTSTLSTSIQDLIDGKKHAPQSYTFEGPHLTGSLHMCVHSCRSILITHLQNSQDSIHFASFTFTDLAIANILLEKHMDNLSIKGVIERNSASKEVAGLLSNLNVVRDHNKYVMHHKFFIIDNRTVITGSYNPTLGADQKNLETLIVLESQDIVDQFNREFVRLFTPPS